MLGPLIGSMPPSVRTYWKGALLYADDMTDSVISTLVDTWAKRPLPAMGPALLPIELHGGAAGAKAGRERSKTTLDGKTYDVPVGAFRDALWSIGFLSYYMGAENDDTVRTFTRNLHKSVIDQCKEKHKYYVNYHSDIQNASKVELFGKDPAVFAKLCELKQKYDPNDIFKRGGISLKPVEQS